MNEQLSIFNDKSDRRKELEEKLPMVKLKGTPEAYYLFRQRLYYALLHKDPNKYQLIDKVIEQAKAKGLSYILCKVSAEAKKFIDLSRQVAGERHRAISFLRLKPIDQHNVLMGEFEIVHQTGEIIMLHFLKRFPKYRIMLVFGNEVLIGQGNEIFREKIERKKVTLPSTPDEFERYWLAFYRSQYIPERRNLKYFQRMIPKKYWRWVTELKEFGLN